MWQSIIAAILLVFGVIVAVVGVVFYLRMYRKQIQQDSVQSHESNHNEH